MKRSRAGNCRSEWRIDVADHVMTLSRFCVAKVHRATAPKFSPGRRRDPMKILCVRGRAMNLTDAQKHEERRQLCAFVLRERLWDASHIHLIAIARVFALV